MPKRNTAAELADKITTKKRALTRIGKLYDMIFEHDQHIQNLQILQAKHRKEVLLLCERFKITEEECKAQDQTKLHAKLGYFQHYRGKKVNG